jgi:hypothetical protein
VQAYSAWLLHALQSCNRFKEINEEVYSAQKIAEAFLAKTALPTTPLNDRALKNFYHANAQSIDAVILQWLIQFLEINLAKEIVGVLKFTLSRQEYLSVASQQRGSMHKLADIIYYWRLNEHSEFAYWDDLLKFAARFDLSSLLLMTGLKAHPRIPFMNHEKTLEASVQSLLDKGLLVTVLNDLLVAEGRAVPPGKPQRADEQLAGPSHGYTLTDAEFLTLVNILLQTHAGNVLNGPFVQRLAVLQDTKALRTLGKTVKKFHRVAPEFVNALDRYR